MTNPLLKPLELEPDRELDLIKARILEFVKEKKKVSISKVCKHMEKDKEINFMRFTEALVELIAGWQLTLTLDRHLMIRK